MWNTCGLLVSVPVMATLSSSVIVVPLLLIVLPVTDKSLMDFHTFDASSDYFPISWILLYFKILSFAIPVVSTSVNGLSVVPPPAIVIVLVAPLPLAVTPGPTKLIVVAAT